MREIRIRKRADRRWSWVAGVVVMIAASVLLISGVGHVLALRESGREIGSIGELERYLSIESEEYEPGGKYVLTADLDLTGKEITIGDNVEPFVGELDGAGHEIKGLSRPLFGKVGQGAKIENLVVEGTIREGELYGAGEGYIEGYGLLAAHIEGAEIRNVGAVGEIEIGDRAEREVRVRKGNEEGTDINEEGKGNKEESGKPETEGNGEGIKKEEPNIPQEPEATDSANPETGSNGEGTNKKEEGITNKEELSKPEPEGNQPEQGSNREELSKPEGTGEADKPEEPAVGEPEPVVDPVAKLFGPVKAMAAEADIVSPEEDTTGTGEGTNVPDTTPTTPDTGDTGAVPQPGEPAEGEGTGTPTDPEVPTEPEAPVDPAPDQKEDITQPEDTAGDEYIRTTAEEVYAGGLIGVSEGESLIQNCYAFVKITKKGNETAASAGGFIGVLKEGGRIENSYATGSVEGAAVLGGFAGINEGGIGVCYVSNTLGAGEERGAFAGRYGERASAKECAYDYRMSCGEDKEAQRKGTEELTGIQDSLSGEWHYTEGAYPQLPYFALNEKIEIQKKSKASAIALQLGSGTIEGVEGEIELVREIEGEAVEWSASGDISLTEEGKAVLKSSAEEEGTSAPEEGIVYSGVLRAVLGMEEKTFVIATAQKTIVKEEENSIKIYSVDDWKYYFTDISSTTMLNQDIEIMADLNFSTVKTSAATESGYPFTGTVKGNGHSITDMSAPLFGYMEDVVVEDISLRGNISESGTESLGLLARNIESKQKKVTISNVKIYGSVTYTGKNTGVRTGGLAGQITGTSDNMISILNCYSAASVKGYWYTGGIIGRGFYVNVVSCNNSGSLSNAVPASGSQVWYLGEICGSLSYGAITDCSAYGYINSNGSYNGKVVGIIDNAEIRNCTSTGSLYTKSGGGGIVGWAENNCVITDCVSSDITINGARYNGGILGYGKQVKIENCTAENITFQNIDQYTGGIAGIFSEGSVKDCIAVGINVKSYSDSIGNKIGGLIGEINKGGKEFCEIEISNCSVNGLVQGRSQVGGLVGFIDGADGVIENCVSTCAVSSEVLNDAGGISATIRTINGLAIKNYVFSGTLDSLDNNDNGFYESLNGNVTFTNCYYNKELAGILNENGMGISNEEMLQGTPLSGLEEGSVWKWEQGKYPHLTHFADSEEETIRNWVAAVSTPIFLADGDAANKVSKEIKIDKNAPGSWSIDPSAKFDKTPDGFAVKTDGAMGTVTLTYNWQGYTKFYKMKTLTPILITSLEDWEKYLGNEATEADLAKAYKLEFADGTCDFSALKVSAASLDSYFTGTLYGNNQTITGLNKPLFQKGRLMEVYDLTIEGKIEGKYTSTALLAASLTEAASTSNRTNLIKNCHAKGSVTNGENSTSSSTGGLVGSVSGRVQLIDCSSAVDIEGSSGVGGLVGSVSSGSYNYSGPRIVIKNCYIAGNIKGTDNVGGIAGNLLGNVNTLDGKVEKCLSMAVVRGNTNVGGLIGNLKIASMSNCYFGGTVDGVDSVGGISGRTHIRSKRYNNILNCLSAGRVNGVTNTGAITGQATFESDGDSSCYQNCYYDTQAAGTVKVGNEADAGEFTGIIGKKTAELTGDAAKSLPGIGESGDWTFETMKYPILTIPDVSAARLASTAILLGEGDTYEQLSQNFTIDPDAGTWSVTPKGVLNINGGSVELNELSGGNLTLICQSGAYAKSFVLSAGEGKVIVIDSLEAWEQNLGRDATPESMTANYRLADRKGEVYDFSDLSASTGNTFMSFKGTLDGNGQTIVNLNVPLFGIAEGVTIQNLTVQGNIETKKAEPQGMLVCEIKGEKASHIANCHTSGSIYGGTYIGGLIGKVTGNSERITEITDCSSTADVNKGRTASYAAGGLIGRADYILMNTCFATGNVVGSHYAAGLIGMGVSSTIDQCFSIGPVKCIDDRAGGFIGYAESGKISNCYAAGPVEGMRAGGFAGSTNSTAAIENCYASGRAKSENSYAGFAAGVSNYTLQNCYYDAKSSGLYADIIGITPLTTTEMTGTAAIPGITTNSEVWTRTAGYYPELNVFHNNSATAALSQLSATAIFFEDSSADATGVTGSIRLSYGDISGWSLLPSDIMVLNTDARTLTPNYNGTTLLNYTQGGYTKTFILESIGQSRVIRNPEDWNYYLGAGANKASLGGTYQLDVSGDFDFSTILDSAGEKLECSFTGVLDGNGQQIYNLTVPLFDVLSGAAIKNLNIKGSINTSKERTGLLANQIVLSTNKSQIENCHVSGSIHNSREESYTGGMVGYSDTAVFDGCKTDVEVTTPLSVSAASYTGGLIGKSNNDSIIRCEALGKVQGVYYTGGLIGYSEKSTIEECYSASIVSGKNFTGGMVGYGLNSTGDKLVIDSSVQGETYTGGFTGYWYGKTIMNCFVSGNVQGIEYAGGLGGYVDIMSCSNIVCTAAVKRAAACGGLAGKYRSVTFTNCYYDRQMSGVENGIGENANISGITGALTKDLIGVTSLTGINGNSLWTQTEGLYPQLTNLTGNADCKLAAVPLVLYVNPEDETQYDTLNNVTQSSVSLLQSAGDNALTWTVSDPINMTISGHEVSFLNGGGFTLTAHMPGANQTKQFKLDVFSSAIAIRSLNDWENYLGEGADAKFLDKEYYLDFADGGCDFSGLTQSAGYKNAFTGVLDGRNQKITGLKKPLLQKVEGAVIKNIVVEGDIEVEDGYYTGLLAGTIGSSAATLIENCHSSGRIFQPEDMYIGGLIGDIRGNATVRHRIENCSSMTDITASAYVGNLIGYATYTDISNCFASGTVKHKQTNVGGFAGFLKNTTVDNCYATGRITNNGQPFVGGFTGCLWGGSISNSFSAVQITSTKTSKTGAFIGNLKSTGCALSNCYFDRQLSGMLDAVPVNTSNIVPSQIDNYVVGLKTTECLGPNVPLKDLDAWLSVENRYPQLKFFAQNADTGLSTASAVSAIPIILAEAESPFAVTSDITWFTDMGTIETSPGGILEVQGNKIKIGAGAAGQQQEAVIKISSDGYKKEFGVNIIGDPIRITSLADWETYLGKDATGETLKGVYILDFPGGEADFGGLSPVKSNSYLQFNAFMGVLDGNNSKIFNLSRTLFSDLCGAKISNLIVEGDVVPVRNNYGLLAADAGDAYDTFLENCHAMGRIRTEENKNYYLGGLVGKASSDAIYLNQCSATIEIQGKGYYLGGLVGFSKTLCIDSSFANIYAEHDESGRYNNYAGGLAGQSDVLKAANSYACGVINDGDVIGGLVGYADTLELKNCYASDTIAGKSYIGSLIGVENAVWIENSYYDSQMTGAKPTYDYFYEYGRTTEELTAGSLPGFNDSNIWSQETGTYPQLYFMKNHLSKEIRDASRVSVAALQLAEDDTVNAMREIKNYSSFNGSWSSQPDDAVAFQNGTASILKSGKAVILCERDGYERRFSVYIRTDSAAVTIHNLAEWETYLGKNATPDDLSNIYKLEFENGTCDFSDLQDSAGSISGKPFTGKLYGNNQTITGLDKPLFKEMKGAFISSLTLQGTIETAQRIDLGLLAAKVVKGARTEIIDCHGRGELKTTTTSTSSSGMGNIGGLVGTMEGQNGILHLVQNCSTDVVISGYALHGGMIGTGQYVTIENCSSSVNLSNDRNYTAGGIIGSGEACVIRDSRTEGIIDGYSAGGIAGSIKNSGTITGCSFSGTIQQGRNAGGIAGVGTDTVISNCYSEAEIKSDFYAGGIVGVATNVEIENCFSNGSCVTSGTSGTGGLVGYAKGLKMRNSYAVGYVLCLFKTGEGDCGGLIGSTVGELSLTNCYFAGLAEQLGCPPEDRQAGGLIGRSNSAATSTFIQNSTFDSTLSGLTQAVGSANAEDTSGYGKTTQEMTTGVLDGFTADQGWTHQAGAYPELEIFHNSGNAKDALASRISSIAVYLTNDMKGNDFSGPFTFDSGLTGTWTDEKEFFEFGSGTAAIKPEKEKRAEVVSVYYTEGESKKPFAFQLHQNKTTTITSLQDWENYLGAQATPQTLAHNYKLAFPDGSCDFSQLKMTELSTFYGSLDGNNQRIYGLKIPLFGDREIVNGSISNLKLEGAVSGPGMLTRKIAGTTVTNCHVKGAVECKEYYYIVGGLVGWSDQSTVSECTAMVNVTGWGIASANSYVGGITGNTTNSTFTNCFAVGKMVGGARVGGFVGDAGSNSTFNQCYASATIMSSYGGVYAGGFAGVMSGSGGSNCYSASMILVPKNGQVGGFTGIGNAVSSFYSDGRLAGVGYSGNSSGNSIATENLTGSVTLPGFADNSSWTLSKDADLYPQLTVFAESTDDYLKQLSEISAVPVFLKSDSSGQNVRSELHYDPLLPGAWTVTPEDGVNWDQNAGTISPKTAKEVSIKYSIGDNLEKVFYLKFLGTDEVTVIHNLEEWETYLGYGADYSTTSGNYRLEFPENKCDFSSLSGSAGSLDVMGFRGTLDGNNQKITGLKHPLFELVSGNIKDITVEGTIHSDDEFSKGLLANKLLGKNENISIENCHASGSVVTSRRGEKLGTGGLIGEVSGGDYEIAIVNSSADVHLEGYGAVGGLIGLTNSSYKLGVRMEGCSSRGTITSLVGEGYFYGGLVGSLNRTNMKNCSAACNIEVYNGTAGGLIGKSGSYSEIDSCFAMSNLKVTKGSAGGFIGYVSDSGGTIRSSYASGNIDTVEATAGGFVGSIGYWDINTYYFSNCFLTGQVSSENGIRGSFVGSISPVFSNNGEMLQRHFASCTYDSLKTGSNISWCGKSNLAENSVFVKGMKTDQMTDGTGFPGVGGSEWILEPGFYPRPKYFGDRPEAVLSSVTVWPYKEEGTNGRYDALNGITNEFTVPLSGAEGVPVSWSSSDPEIVFLNDSGESVFKGKKGRVKLTAACGGITKEFNLNVILSMKSMDEFNVTLPIVDSAAAGEEPVWSKVLLNNTEGKEMTESSILSTDGEFKNGEPYALADPAAITANYSTYGTVNANAKLGFALETSSGTEVDLSQAVTTPITGVTGIKLYNAAAYNCAEDQYFRIILEVPDDRSVAINVTIPGITSKKLDITVPTPTQISLQPGIRSKSYTDEWEIKNDTAYPLAVTLASVVPGSVPGEEGTLGLVDPSIPIRPGEELITQGVKLGLAYTEEDEGESVEKGIYYNPAEGAEQPVLGLGAGRIQKFKYFLEYSPYYTGTQRTFNYQLKYETKIPEYDIVPGNLAVKDASAGTETPPAE
ncbi:ZmpA/ZmpB/ZmpC family metallo-endopeptidase-related protein [Anaerolentibacter hominis]|uniref:ZmpA/ZmpB/ZmpC family metallo-endopeptidase-related protein n=1 Tax=Anaerolentibacter hominis TaxID=3079009 RepID=UPI0031B8124B